MENMLNFNDKTVFINKNNSRRKQYTISMKTSMMSEITKLHIGLQLMLDSPISKAEVIELVIKKGLNSIGEAVIIDNNGFNEVYSFDELLRIQEWVEKDLIVYFKKALSSIQGIEEIDREAKILATGETIEEDNIISYYLGALWDKYILDFNKYYKIKDLKILEKITISPQIIKAALYMYKNMDDVIENYKEIIEEFTQEYLERSDIEQLILKTAINAASDMNKFDEKIFKDSNWIKKYIKYTKYYGVEYSKVCIDDIEDIEDQLD